MIVAKNRSAFGRRLTDMPMVRRQLAKLPTPTEQALSMSMFTAATLEAAQKGDLAAANLLHILTPLPQIPPCRDHIHGDPPALAVSSGNASSGHLAMEQRTVDQDC